MGYLESLTYIGETVVILSLSLSWEQKFLAVSAMGGVRSFLIESKSFQLVVEEGGRFFLLRIF